MAQIPPKSPGPAGRTYCDSVVPSKIDWVEMFDELFLLDWAWVNDQVKRGKVVRVPDVRYGYQEEWKTEVYSNLGAMNVEVLYHDRSRTILIVPLSTRMRANACTA